MQDVFQRDDELSIPDSAYELPSSQRGSSNKRLAIIATVIGVALVGVGGGLELASRRSGEIPVISADSHPIRVKPANPGGMQVIGANESGSDAGGVEAMAPAPEAPNPGALHAEQQAEQAARTRTAQATPAQATPPQAAPASPALATPSAQMLARTGTAAPGVPLPPLSGATTDDPGHATTLPTAHGRPGPAITASATSTSVAPPPAPRAAASATAHPAPAAAATATPARTVATATPATAEPAATGHKVAQLAAVASEDAASAEWGRLEKRMPDLLGGRRPEIVKYEHDGHTFFRLRTGGFADSADASAFCGKVRAKGANCAVF